MTKLAKILSLIATCFIQSVYAAVYYVTPDGTGNGTSWSDATTLAGANAKVAAGDTIRMKAGTYTMTATVTISKAITVEGGYKGEVDEDLTLADNPETVLDGAYNSGVTEAVTITSSSGTNYFYRMAFARFYRRGFFKKSKSSLEMYDCRFLNNSPTIDLTHQQDNTYGGTGGGRGACFAGHTGDYESTATLVLSNCIFRGNVLTRVLRPQTGSSSTRYSAGFGFGANFSNWKKVNLLDCSFIDNGFDSSITNVSNSSTSTLYAPVRYGKGAAFYAYKAPIKAENCKFIGNNYLIASDITLQGIVDLNSGCGGSTFNNCAWVGNRVARGSYSLNNQRYASAVTVDVSAGNTVDFNNCTIAYNIAGSRVSAAGLIVNTGDVSVRNSIIYGNSVRSSTAAPAYKDIQGISANGSLNVSTSLLTREYANAYITESDCKYGNPEFVTNENDFQSCVKIGAVSSSIYNYFFEPERKSDVLNFDVHLLSADGYFDNSGKSYPKGSTDVTSIAIDAGAVDSDYSKEPMPNGGVVNLGCYGNTPEASKSPSGGQPTLAADDVVVTFTEYGQPTITVTPKAADSSKYKAIVSINVTGKVKGSGVIAEETKIFDFSKAGIEPENIVEMAIQEIFDPDSQLTISIRVTADGAQDVVLEKTVSVSGSLPECYGRGNNNVVHYWADAPGRNDGSSWVHAYRDLSSALGALSAEKSELWVAGSNVLHASTATLVSTFNSTIRGGFTECCDSLEDREDGAISVIDGNNKYALFTVSVTGGLTCFIERMKFCRSGSRNIKKFGQGNLSLYGCVISDCAKSVTGSGICISGEQDEGVDKSVIVAGENLFDSCCFENLAHTTSSKYNCAGAAVWVRNAVNVILNDCEFKRNGNFDKLFSRDGRGGAAIYSEDTPVVANGCSFVGNVERSVGSKDNILHSAGSVMLYNACGGSAFTNCLWLGNCGTYCNDQDSRRIGTSTNSAAVVVSLKNSTDTVDFANCTFAYNMSDSELSSAGILMLKGKGSAVNSIFTGAVTGTCSRVANQVYVNKGSSMTLDYCMFDAEGDYGAAEGGTVTASNIMYADPRLVYSRDDFATGGNVDLVNGIYNSNGSGIASVLANANAHLLGGSGYTDEKSGQVVKTSRRYPSPAIDAGKPGYDYSLEPMPNGRRVNLGFYGNTPWATMSDRRGMKIIIR